jgi:AcrR family transcriptional regulator
MATARRIGTETSETRNLLLNCVEQLMLEEGYAAVTYRAVAARAGVTGGLVQYYFPKLDDVFTAAIRRRTEQNLDRLVTGLRVHADAPLRFLWEYGRDEATAALTVEFTALGNHRKSIRAVIADVTEQVRQVQLDAIRSLMDSDHDDIALRLSPTALLFLLTGVPKLISMEEGAGVVTSHREAVETFERFLDAVEPGSPTPEKPRRRATKRRAAPTRQRS